MADQLSDPTPCPDCSHLRQLVEQQSATIEQLVVQQQALLAYARAVDAIAYSEGQGAPELLAACLRLGVDPRNDLEREAAGG